MVKSKEKILNSREKKLKELEKKLHIKEISLSDQVQQNDFSKAYIVTMENKVKELESSNRLMKMKLLSQADAIIDLPTPRDTSSNNHVQSQSYNHHPEQSPNTPLHDRLVSLEMKLLEHRVHQLEQAAQLSYRQNYLSNGNMFQWSAYTTGYVPHTFDQYHQYPYDYYATYHYGNYGPGVTPVYGNGLTDRSYQYGPSWCTLRKYPVSSLGDLAYM